MPIRIEQLTAWLNAHLPASQTLRDSLQPVAGDASFRRYFRATTNTGKTYIAMDAPPDKEDSKPFVEITMAWRKQHVPLPEIHAHDLNLGFLLLEDFGDTLFFSTVAGKSKEIQKTQYAKALEQLHHIQALSDPETLPPYDRALLTRELKLLTDWLIGEALNIELSHSDNKVINDAFEVLIENALEQPRCAVHRDYHSRNLMQLDHQEIGVIDFQDAVHGPITYDLVSLLRDCYIKLDPQLVEHLALQFKTDSTNAELRNMTDQRYLEHLDLMGIQRHVKAAGIFARLALRDGKLSYIQDIPRTFEYIIENCAKHEALREFGLLLERRVAPSMREFVEKHAQSAES